MPGVNLCLQLDDGGLEATHKLHICIAGLRQLWETPGTSVNALIAAPEVVKHQFIIFIDRQYHMQMVVQSSTWALHKNHW